MAQVQELIYQIVIEEDKAEKNFTAYIPAIRLGARGDTLEEVRENAKDLLQMEIESRRKKGKSLPTDATTTIEQISIAIPTVN